MWEVLDHAQMSPSRNPSTLDLFEHEEVIRQVPLPKWYFNFIFSSYLSNLAVRYAGVCRVVRSLKLDRIQVRLFG